jgi:flagellar FliL protein
MSVKKEEGTEAKAPAAPKPKPPLIVILLGVNTLAALGAVGMLAYSKIVYKRPPITESGEREKLKAKFEKPRLDGPPGSLAFNSVTINLAPGQADTGSQNKIHYATVAFNITTIDQGSAAKLESVRPLLQDRMISMVSKRSYQDLTSVQGRYLLRTQMREAANQVAQEVLATDVHFTEFVVQ